MELIFHGAAKEIGRSCIELKLDNGEKYLLDVGVKFSAGGLEFPVNVGDIKEFQGVFLSHAHLDHSGGLPLFESKQLKGPIFCSRLTFAISKLMLKDSYKVARIRNLHPEYSHHDLKQVKKDTLLVKFDKWYKHNSLRFKFLNAGHIPGSAMIWVQAEGKNLLYTADFNLVKSALMFPANISEPLKNNIDILITESTYGDKQLPDRQKVSEDFLNKVEEVVKRGGSVIIPVFSLGRAQEVLILLGQREWGVPIYTEGLGNKVARKVLANRTHYVDNKETLREVFYNKVQWVSSKRKRGYALAKQAIYVSTSGMVQGGPVIEYIRAKWHDPKNAILLMGFQAKNTNGRNLLDKGIIYLDGQKTVVQAEIQKFDFSGHSSSDKIKELVTKINPKNVIFQHGNEDAISNLKEWADKNLKSKSYAPDLGDKIKF